MLTNLDYLKKVTSDPGQLVWLGAEAYDWQDYQFHGTSWEWYDYNTAFEYTNFGPGQGEAEVGYGIAIKPSTGEWFVTSSDTKLPTLCEWCSTCKIY
uniref:C-type lectin domain-containing protein n=1 Tax=Acrobeloides nanus TaxID=290746 RepID=A0A914C734_9BILA